MGWASTGNPTRVACQSAHVGHGQPTFRDVGHTAVAQEPFEGLVDRVDYPDIDQGLGEVGPADPLLAAGVRRHHGKGDRDPELAEPLDEGQVAGTTVVAEPVELDAERAGRVVDEVHQHVDAT